MRITMMPVSYTHLDVYKRQLLHNAIDQADYRKARKEVRKAGPLSRFDSAPAIPLDGAAVPRRQCLVHRGVQV